MDVESTCTASTRHSSREHDYYEQFRGLGVDLNGAMIICGWLLLRACVLVGRVLASRVLLEHM